MFDFYLTILDSIAQSQEYSFQIKFNKLVYAEPQLSADEKFYLLGELQRRSQKYANAKKDKKD